MPRPQRLITAHTAAHTAENTAANTTARATVHATTHAPTHTAALAATLAALAAVAGCQTAPPAPPTNPDVVGEYRAGSGYLKGYIDRTQLPDSLALLPKPPAAGSAEQAADLATYRSTRALRDTPRWALAAADDNLKFPKVAELFSCALDMPISQDATPHLNMLLRRTLVDAGLSTYGAKDHYKRQRPFAALNEGSCAPGSEASLRNDGSYPSGHAALSWGWALVLAGIAPDRADAVLQRGYDFGQSRVICGVHWQSDVDNGRLMGAAAVARLQSDATFLAQSALARQEITDARAKGAKSPLNCAAEKATLGR